MEYYTRTNSLLLDVDVYLASNSLCPATISLCPVANSQHSVDPLPITKEGKYEEIRQYDTNIHRKKLIQYAASNDVQGLRKFLYINTSQNDLYDAMESSILYGALDSAISLIYTNIDISRDHDELLCMAFDYKQYDIFYALVKFGYADINARNGYLLTSAVDMRDFGLIKFLVHLGADINANTKILFHSVMNNDYNIVRYFIRHKIDLTIWNNFALKIAKSNNYTHLYNMINKHIIRQQYNKKKEWYYAIEKGGSTYIYQHGNEQHPAYKAAKF